MCHCFNPRTHTGATGAWAGQRWRTVWFQSTHPYGCDETAYFEGSIQSGFNPRTHTGATSSCHRRFMPDSFQSTHPYGCDFMPDSNFLCFALFQSTHPYGCDDNAHQPAVQSVGFNPRTHTGATREFVGHIRHTIPFQSTHPYGCDW